MVLVTDSAGGREAKYIVEKSKRDHGISAHLALINFLKGMIGPGCFSLPLAFKNAGLWTAFILVFAIGFMCCVCMMKLVRCSQELSKRIKTVTTLDYGQVAEESFRNGFQFLRPFAMWARLFVNICLAMFQLGVCSVFFIFVVDHAKEVTEYLFPTIQHSKLYYMAASLIPFLAVSLVRSIVVISWISFVGNMFMISSITLIFMQLVTARHHWRDLPTITDFRGIIMAAGAIIYSFEGQAMVLPLENRMKHGSEMRGWTGVLSTGMSLVTIVYVSSGFYGYITYGDAVRGSITLNLPDNGLNLTVKILLMLVILTGFPVQMYSIVEFTWPWIKEKMIQRPRLHRSAAHYGLRCILFALAVLIAVVLPNLEDIIPLVGVSAGMLLALVIPPILEVATILPEMISNRDYLKILVCCVENLFFAIVGVFFCVQGVITNVENLLSHM